MFNVVISPSVNADLFNILRYIAQELENPQAATELADKIEKCYLDLQSMPNAHALCADPLLRFKGYRKYSVGNYLAICRVVEDRSEVRVVHIFPETQNCIGIQRGEI